ARGISLSLGVLRGGVGAQNGTHPCASETSSACTILHLACQFSPLNAVPSDEVLPSSGQLQQTAPFLTDKSTYSLWQGPCETGGESRFEIAQEGKVRCVGCQIDSSAQPDYCECCGRRLALSAMQRKAPGVFGTKHVHETERAAVRECK